MADVSRIMAVEQLRSECLDRAKRAFPGWKPGWCEISV